MASEKRSRLDPNEFCIYCETPLLHCQTIFHDEASRIRKSEIETLFNPKFVEIFQEDEDRWLNITNYYLHDSNGHLVAIDSGLIESGKEVFLVGCVKSIGDFEAEVTDVDSVTFNIGPLVQWWISGYDGGAKVILGVESECCQYTLLKPHSLYKDYMDTMWSKIMLTKYVIEFVTANPLCNCQDLLDYVVDKEPNFTEKQVLKNIQFVLDQIQSYDEAADVEDEMIFESECVQELIQLCAQNNLKIKARPHQQIVRGRVVGRKDRRKISNSDSYTTCTDLVASFFEEIFNKVMNETGKGEAAQLKETLVTKKKAFRSESQSLSISWIEAAKHHDPYSGRTYYDAARIGRDELRVGDTASTTKQSDGKDTGICRLIQFYEDKTGKKLAHVNWLIFSEDTVLEETGMATRVYLLQECSEIDLNVICARENVEFKSRGAISDSSFICDRIYSRENGSFTALTFDLRSELEKNRCIGCHTSERKKSWIELSFEIGPAKDASVVEFRQIKMGDTIFHPGSFALLEPESLNIPNHFTCKFDISNHEEYDEGDFPEFYRKRFTGYVKGSLDDCPAPLAVVQIQKIFRGIKECDEDASVIVRLFYRAENFLETLEEILKYPLNQIFMTTSLKTIKCRFLKRKCQVFFPTNEERVWDIPEADHFYCVSKYDLKAKVLEPCKSSELLIDESNLNAHIAKTCELIPLKTMDLFAGCGGLSLGFHMSKVADTKWAVEKDPSSARSFEVNFPQATVYNEDCNVLLKAILDGKMGRTDGKDVPQKGEVEMILAGPPCQGFSSLNRFSERLYSTFKNSLIATFLSFVDFYRPRVVVFENVRDFVLFEKSKILKLTLSCLLKMDYQVSFGVAQAGLYGVPQSRRRVFLIATSLETSLPTLPQPIHVFSKRCCLLDTIVGKKRFASSTVSKNGTFRPLTVADAINDLPRAVGSDLDHLTEYTDEPRSHYQKLMRKGCLTSRVSLHVCRSVNQLIQARIDRIPRKPGADWRDLPNVQVILPNGTVVKRLQYLYHDAKNGLSPSGNLRGVCKCASGKVKDCNKQQSRQDNTLIPWGLVHTANRNYHWSGLFGRLQWNGAFITTITKTVPSSKQGSVIHPSENRTISIRECARSQSFPDSFVFIGTLLDVKTQIGNAVPPLMARAIGMEIRKKLSNQNSVV